MRLPVEDPRLADLNRCWGLPYVYGAGCPADGLLPEWYLGVESTQPGALRGFRGYDCSGIWQVLAVRWSILAADQPDRRVSQLWAITDTVPENEARLGDLAFYGVPEIASPRHVMVALGNGAVFGACGGSEKTFGDDARAYLDFRRVRYWSSAFMQVRRLKPAFAPKVPVAG